MAVSLGQPGYIGGGVFTGSTATSWLDATVIPLNPAGTTYVKVIDLIFIVGGLILGLLIGGDIGLVVAILGIALGVSGVLMGWD